MRRSRSAVFLLVILLLTIRFNFINSTMLSNESGGDSDSIRGLIVGVVEKVATEE